MVDGYVIALSNAGSLARYETLRTLVQLPGRWDIAAASDGHAAKHGQLPRHERADHDDRGDADHGASTQNIAPVNSGEPVSATTPRPVIVVSWLTKHLTTSTHSAPAPPPLAAGLNHTCSIASRCSTSTAGRRSRCSPLVVGWVMVDSYTRIPVYRATARVLIEDPNADIATPTEIARNVTLARSRHVHADATAHHEGPRSRAARRGQARHEQGARVQRPGPQADAAGRRHRVGEVLRGVAVSHDHVDAGRCAAADHDARPRRGDGLPGCAARRGWPSARCAAASWST